MMNVQYKIMMALFTLGTIICGCESQIYDDLADCPQGVYVKFYSMSPCEVDSTYIGEVSDLVVFAFNEEDKLVTTVSNSKVNLNRDYEVLVPVQNGYYTFIAWAGLNSSYTKGVFQTGITTKQDVMLTIKAEERKAQKQNTPERIWQGESQAVFLPDPLKHGSLYKHTQINLHEITNRIKVVVEFDKKYMKGYNPNELNVEVKSANGVLNIDGTMPINSPLLSYYSPAPKFTDNSGTWDFSTLDLVTGYNNILKITYSGNGEEELVFDGDLIASILLRTVEGGVNLNCDNDFVIKFVIKDYCQECWTQFSCSVYVNNWLVHSYSTEL